MRAWRGTDAVPAAFVAGDMNTLCCTRTVKVASWRDSGTGMGMGWCRRQGGFDAAGFDIARPTYSIARRSKDWHMCVCVCMLTVTIDCVTGGDRCFASLE